MDFARGAAKVIIVGLVQGIVGWLVVRGLDSTVDSSAAKDAAIIAAWFTLIIAGMIIVAVWLGLPARLLGSSPQIVTQESAYPSISTPLSADQSGRPIATPAELTQSYIHGRTVRISDVPRDGLIIKGKTFEECDIIGPAILILLGTTLMHGSTFEGDFASVFWQLPAKKKTGTGAIGLEDCTVRKCLFRLIGIAGPREVIEKARAGFV